MPSRMEVRWVHVPLESTIRNPVLSCLDHVYMSCRFNPLPILAISGACLVGQCA